MMPRPGMPPPGMIPFGIAPPPVGPRLPNPKILDGFTKVRRALIDLADVIEKEMDPRAAKIFNPLLEDALAAGAEYAEPPKPPKAPREEDEDAPAGPLDRTPSGDPSAGTPLPQALPRLLGLPAMR